MRIKSLLVVPLLAALGACVATIPPVEVTRFHLNQPIPPGTVATAALPGLDPTGLEFRTYAFAVERQLGRLGFAVGDKSEYIAEIGYFRDTRERVASRSPVTIGIGGGSFGRGGGIGIGTSFGVGGGGSRADIVSHLEVRLKRRGDARPLWEGRAQTVAPQNAPAAQPGLAADKLAVALFADFPGESGRTIEVP